MSDAYQNCEDLGRKNFVQVLENNPKIKTFKFSEKKCEYYDCEVIDAKDNKIYIELKHRAKLSSKDKCIVEEGVMLEKMKLENLKSFKDGRHLYVYLLNDAIGYIFDLDKIDFSQLPITKKWCPKNGVDHSKGYIMKDCYMLLPKLACKTIQIPNYIESQYWKNHLKQLQKQTYVNYKER